MAYGGGPPMGGHGGSDPNGGGLGSTGGWMSGSMGNTPARSQRKGCLHNPILWVALGILIFMLYLIFT